MTVPEIRLETSADEIVYPTTIGQYELVNLCALHLKIDGAKLAGPSEIRIVHARYVRRQESSVGKFNSPRRD
jgi:hypothetical protein